MTPLVKPFDLIPLVLSLSKGALSPNSGFIQTRSNLLNYKIIAKVSPRLNIKPVTQ